MLYLRCSGLQVRHGTQGQIVDASLKRSTIWRRVKVLKLSINMRVQRMLAADAAAAAKQQDFADYLLRVGEGREQTYPLLGDSMIRLPESLCCPTGKLLQAAAEVVLGTLQCLAIDVV